jgi:hypothetical protein
VLSGEQGGDNFPQKLAGKFTKTLTGTLRRLSDILSDDTSDKVAIFFNLPFRANTFITFFYSRYVVNNFCTKPQVKNVHIR